MDITEKVMSIIRRAPSVRQLAEKSGVGQATIYDWRRGRTQPTLTSAEMVLKALGYRLAIVKEADNEKRSN